MRADIEGVAMQLKERPRVPQGCMQRLRWPRSLKSAVEIPPSQAVERTLSYCPHSERSGKRRSAKQHVERRPITATAVDLRPVLEENDEVAIEQWLDFANPGDADDRCA